MNYSNICEAIFIDRPNRFIANVSINGRTETVHVKNTGRCRELLIPGVKVILFDSDNPLRKTRYDLIAVWKDNMGWINIDSQAPNAVVKEWLMGSNQTCGNQIGDSHMYANQFFNDIKLVKPECQYGDSRFDFYVETADRRIFIEVKGCTLEIDCEGFFPDAPTKRGAKHLRELIRAASEGYDTYIAFVIAMNNISVVHPNAQMDPEFAKAFGEATRSGVKVLFLPCEVTPDELSIIDCIENHT